MQHSRCRVTPRTRTHFKGVRKIGTGRILPQGPTPEWRSMDAMPRVTVGVGINSRPPISRTRMIIRAARVMRLDSLWAIDHWLDFPPTGIWDEDFSWTAKAVSSPHEFFGWAPLLGWAVGRAGKIRLAVGVTDPIRHHPVKLAQDALTLAHLARQPPILGIGVGEAENLIP